MAGFPDLVLMAQPRLMTCRVEATAGATWRWVFEGVVDEDDNPVDLSSATFACTIVNPQTGATIASPTVTGGLGTFTVEVLASANASLVPAVRQWSLRITSAGQVVQFWGGPESTFTIRAA